MEVPAATLEFWQQFQAHTGEDASARFYELFHFDDNQPSANELAALVLAGVKRATAGLVWSFEGAKIPLPAAGNLSIVTNWARMPRCIIETIAVAVVPFEEVSEEFAATEGEGDGSLRYWREAHWAYFGRECLRIGRERCPTMPVVCERFKVVYRAAS